MIHLNITRTNFNRGFRGWLRLQYRLDHRRCSGSTGTAILPGNKRMDCVAGADNFTSAFDKPLALAINDQNMQTSRPMCAQFQCLLDIR